MLHLLHIFLIKEFRYETRNCGVAFPISIVFGVSTLFSNKAQRFSDTHRWAGEKMQRNVGLF